MELSTGQLEGTVPCEPWKPNVIHRVQSILVYCHFPECFEYICQLVDVQTEISYDHNELKLRYVFLKKMYQLTFHKIPHSGAAKFPPCSLSQRIILI